MSEKDKSDNARRCGRRAFHAGVPLEDNPMRSRDSRYFWEEAWRDERRRDREAHECLREQLVRLGRGKS